MNSSSSAFCFESLSTLPANQGGKEVSGTGGGGLFLIFNLFGRISVGYKGTLGLIALPEEWVKGCSPFESLGLKVTTAGIPVTGFTVDGKFVGVTNRPIDPPVVVVTALVAVLDVLVFIEFDCMTGAFSQGGLRGEKLFPPESTLNVGSVLELELEEPSPSRPFDEAGLRVVIMTGALVAVEEAPEFAPEDSMATESVDCG